MVLLQHGELHAENDKLRLLIQRLTRHQFGRRSEQLTPDQLAVRRWRSWSRPSPPTRPARTPRQHRLACRGRSVGLNSSSRNHGALPAHLPRYEVVIDVEDEDCPCCGGAAACHRRVAHRATRYRAVAAAGPGDPAPALCLPCLRRRHCRGPRARSAGRWWHADRGADHARGGEQIRRLPAALPAGADAGTAGYQAGPLDPRRIGSVGPAGG